MKLHYLSIGALTALLCLPPPSLADKYDDAISSQTDEMNKLPSSKEETIQKNWKENVKTPRSGANSSPSGMIAAFNVNSCPSGWSDFSIPGRTLVGEGYLHDGTAGLSYPRGHKGGSQYVVLSVAQLPRFQLTFPSSNTDSGNASRGYPSLYNNSSGGGMTSNAIGSNHGHENRMPYYVVKYCRKD